MQLVAMNDVVELIRMEYYEIPGMTLTFWQAQRLWNMSEELCERALLSLVRDNFLMVTPAGTFVRRPDGPVMVNAFDPPVPA